MTKLIDTGELSPRHNYCGPAKVDMAFVSHQEWHAKDSILFELTDDKRLLDCLISDSTSQLNYAVKGDTRSVRQRAMFSLIQLQASLIFSTECVKKLAA